MREKLSKYISYLLRHHPEDLDLNMNFERWVNVHEFIEKINNSGKYRIDLKILKEIVSTDSKQRYMFSPDGKSIRVCQEHSIKTLDLHFPELKPPHFLYHRTSVRNYQFIKKTGIKSMGRQYVHLSENVETAQKVGSRHGEVKIIKIDALKMYHDGIKFHKSNNNV